MLGLSKRRLLGARLGLLCRSGVVLWWDPQPKLPVCFRGNGVVCAKRGLGCLRRLQLRNFSTERQEMDGIWGIIDPGSVWT